MHVQNHEKGTNFLIIPLQEKALKRKTCWRKFPILLCNVLGTQYLLKSLLNILGLKLINQKKLINMSAAKLKISM